jgi:hypothetical protein
MTSRSVRLFILLLVAGGAGGFVGSVIGAAFGHGMLFAGGIAGGLITTPAAAFLAARLRWIDRAERTGTALGAALGFLAAVGVAVNTLHSPVGPLLSPLLVGLGGLAGRNLAKRRIQSGTRH